MTNHYRNLNADKALIWRIVHRENLPWILDHGLHCQSSVLQDPNYVTIGNTDLIGRRSHRVVPVAPGGMLSNYVPFYFTPFSPMMYNIYTGRGDVPKRRNEEISILVSSLHKVHRMGLPFVFTDRHAYPPLARYFNSVESLREIDWPLLQARNFRRNPDDPEQIERYQAEALVHDHLPVTCLIGIICYTDKVKDILDQYVQAKGLKIDIRVLPQWYFQ